ncbi:MAG: signal recognition particle protein [Enterobacterales bacterium]
MFENLSNKLLHAIKLIKGQDIISEENINESLNKIKLALLESDVTFSVVSDLIKSIKKNAIGKKISPYFSPSEEFTKIVYNTLLNIMGGNKQNNILNFSHNIPSVILFIGLQGSGKTTSLGKIGKYLSFKKNIKILTVSSDIYREAAINQLKVLSHAANIDFLESYNTQTPLDIVSYAVDFAKKKRYDILLIDTPGYLSTGKHIFKEIISIYKKVNPIETLFVVDAMSGQEAANTVYQVNKLIPLTGVILTKTDSDARGGAALSVSHITKKPIKFIGNGESLNNLEKFNPKIIVKQILGMDDILTFIESIKDNPNINNMKSFNKITDYKDFNLINFLEQLDHINSMGGISNLINKLPKNYLNKINNICDIKDNKITDIMKSIIYSMTIEERKNPNIIKCSRKKRIAYGSGVKIKDVNNLLTQFKYTKNIIKNIKSNNISSIFNKLKDLFPFKF